MSKKSKAVEVVMYILLAILSFISVFPIFWMLMAATNKSVDISRGRIAPGGYFMENLNSVMSSNLNYFNAFKNSIIIAVITTAIAMVVSSAAGYAFEVYKSKAKDRIFNIILLSMMVPFSALLVPLFRLFSKFKNIPILNFVALDTKGSVVIIAVATAFLIFFFRQNTQSFPKELIEAGKLDGLGHFGIFTRIYMPTMKSTYAAAIIVTFQTAWNNYMWPLIALQSNNQKTVQLVISAMGSSYTPDYGMIMMAVLIATIPMAIIFFTLQKYFVAGMGGAVKG